MNETLKWTLWILGGFVASLVSGLIFTWMCMGYKTARSAPWHIRILAIPFLICGIPFFMVAWCVITIAQRFSGTNVKREEEPVKKTEFKSIDGKTIINCEDLARVRPFKVMVEIPSRKGPTIVGIKYCVRLCDDSVTSEQLYRELDKATQVSKETYGQIIKLKQTWCEHQVLTGKMSLFALTPGMVPNSKEENE